jgi:hypothetical protein
MYRKLLVGHLLVVKLGYLGNKYYTMMFGILTLITALSISAVAIYYSVAGLAAIFAAAVIPIIVMGSVLEIAKLVTAVWLHKYWDRATWWMRTYLSTAVVVLMLITSMGIFGFLSKAHIEQTSMSQEQTAQIGTLDDKIARSEAKIERWTTDLGRLNRGEDVRVDSLIANEQEGLDKIYARIKNEKDGLRADAKIKIDQQQLRIQQAQDRRDSAIAAAEKKFAGSFAGSAEYEAAVKKAKDAELSVASRAQKEILAVNDQLDKDLKAVEGKYASEIATIQKRIQGLRNQANDKTQDIEGKINELEGYIETEQKKIDDAREEKFGYEKEYRKLEAEVGPVKYIAEFIYGEEADQNLLEAAVRWVIITIIFVFDPLAVLLLLAAQYTFEFNRKTKPKDDSGNDNTGKKPKLHTPLKYTDVIGKTYEGKPEPERAQNEDDRTETRENTEEGIQASSETQDQEGVQRSNEDDPTVAGTEEKPIASRYIPTGFEVEEQVEQKETVRTASSKKKRKPKKVEQPTNKEIPDTRNAIFWVEELDKNNSYYVMEDGKQVRKYKQNAEQSEGTIWNRIQENKK